MDPIIVCSICDKALENDIINVQQKGLKTLIAKSTQLGDNKWKIWNNHASLIVHNKCRKWYASASIKSAAARATVLACATTVPDSSSTSSAATPGTSSSLSESTPPQSDFNFRDLCLICGKPWDRLHKQGYLVQHDYMKERLLDIAEQRGDATAIDVIDRLRGVVSLVAVGARYHKKCKDMYSKIPTKQSDSSSRKEEIDSTFRLVSKHIKSSEKGKFTLTELRKVMGDRCLSAKLLYRKLMDYFGEDIHILQQRGSDTLILYKCFSMTKLCGEWYRDPKSLQKKQQEAIVNVSAELIRKDIESYDYEQNSYQPAGKFLSSVESDIPPLLRAFVDKLIVADSRESSADYDERFFVKRSAIAHSIVSTVRSFTSHLQLALGIYIHRKCGSRLIIDLLAKLGFCVSYYQLQQYEASVVMDPPKFVTEDDVFVQHVFDNTDHKVKTFDGYNTYHRLGGIAIYTPENKINYARRTKKLRNAPKVTAASVASQNMMQTIPWTTHSNGLENIEYVDTKDLFLIDSSVLPEAYATYLWAKHCNIQNVPSWTGFMEVLTGDYAFEVAKVICLPLINHPSSNMSTINTALRKALADARQINQKTCFVTFDQPLYYKARALVAASEDVLKDVVVRLGGFHLLMSYLGSIGHIMDGSGLEDLWAVTYAPASVKKMLAGHAYVRAMRAHILTFTALGVMICREMEGEICQQYDEGVKSFLRSWSKDPPTIDDCQTEPIIAKMTTDLIAQLAILKNRGPTAQLWVQYFECIVIALQFVEAEHSGNWKLHLQSIRKMLPIFHAAGHFNYANSVQIYLQDMVNLELTMTDEEFRRFTTEGNFTVRRTDKAWSGMWTDMTIEQTLKRFFGTDLKHSRSDTPSAIARFLAVMPSSFSIIECLEDYCGIASCTSAQHVDLTNHRMKRDDDDIKKFIFWLEEHRPFQPRASLFSLSTGFVGATIIDCYLAFEKGKKSMAWMIGKTVSKISMPASNKVRNLAAVKSGIHVDTENFYSVDSSLLFQRIAVLFRGDEVLTRKAFEFELSPFPLSLFDEFGFMRKTSKSELFQILKPDVSHSDALLRNMIFVIDGGFLLHNVCWPHGASFGVVCEVYHSHIIGKYGDNAWVVFDGYNNEHIGIKSYKRYCRRQRNMAPDIELTESTLVTLTQTRFLSNVSNKMKLVHLLSGYLRTHGINVKVARDDADALIARTAIEQQQCTGRNVAVVGNDTDLLVLLIALADYSHVYFYKITPSAKKNVLYATNDHLNLKPFILFAHAFAGCDTTSAMYGKGKKSLISILHKNLHLQTAVKTFYSSQSTIESLCECAEQLIAYLYNFKNLQQPLHEARYQKFSSLAAHAKVEDRLAQLPPTQPVLREHVKRTYYQVQLWLDNELNPEDWGWKRTSTMVIPVINPKSSAPENLLTLSVCSCTEDCKTAYCTCRNSGLPCTQLCKHCGGQSCSNVDMSANESIDFAAELDLEHSEDYEGNEENDNEYEEMEMGIDFELM